MDTHNNTDARGQRGFTVAELAVVLMIISILSVIALGIANGRIEKARLARCMIDLRSIQSMAWTASDGSTFPHQATFWEEVMNGKQFGPYFYMTDNDDPNCGHGNDLDGFDEQNPGNSKRVAKDIHFVVVCQHDHRTLANYVYIEDEGPPQLAGWGANDPKYVRFIKWIDGGPGGGGGDKPGGPKPK